MKYIIIISLATIMLVALTGCQNKKMEASSENVDSADYVDSVEYAEENYPAITLENADSLIIAAQKGYEIYSTPTRLSGCVGDVCIIREAVDSLTMIRYYKACEGEKNKSAVLEEFKCWQKLEIALQVFHEDVILKKSDNDDPWKHFSAWMSDDKLFLAHTNMLKSDLEQIETCEERVGFKPVKADISANVKKLKELVAKYEAASPAKAKAISGLINSWVNSRSNESLPLPYYNKDINTETFINNLIDYLKTIEDSVE